MGNIWDFIQTSVVPGASNNPSSAGSGYQKTWNGVEHGQMQINDIIFSVPPETIQISQHYSNLEMPLLRTKENSTLKSGHGDYYLSVPLLFPDRIAINNQLAPLIQQFRKTPICLVENELVRRTIFPGTQDSRTGRRMPAADNIAFSMANITVSTVADFPQALQAQLNLMYFNYFPFSNRFTFIRGWDSKSGAIAPSNPTEAATMIDAYNNDSNEVYNPRDSIAWKAFWQYGWDDNSLLSKDMTNTLALTFNQVKYEKNVYTYEQIKWVANEMVPVNINVTFTNRIAKLPILNWAYATHQYIGGMNRSVQITFLCESNSRTNLEWLQLLIKQDHDQATRFRYLSQYWGVAIDNDVTRICGIKRVNIEDCNIDTVPGNPNLLKVTLVLLEHHLRPEQMAPTKNIAQLDGIYQSVINAAINDGISTKGVSVKNVSRSTYEPTPQFDPTGYSIETTSSDELVFSNDAVMAASAATDFTGEFARSKTNQANEAAVNILTWNGGVYNDNLMNLVNLRPDKSKIIPTLPGRDTTDDPNSMYYDRLRSMAQALLDGPMANDPRFSAAKKASYTIKGNDSSNICYPDLDIPPHPATGRKADTEPDCYFYNDSDSKQIDLQKAISRGEDIIRQTYASIQNVTKGTGGMGWDYESQGANTTLGGKGGPFKPTNPRMLSRTAAELKSLPAGSVVMPNDPAQDICKRQNNPGGLKYAAWEAEFGATPGDKGFASFPSPELGVAACAQLIENTYQNGVDKNGEPYNMTSFAQTYFVKGDNISLDQYVSNLCSQIGGGVTGDTSLKDVDTGLLVQAVIKNESSSYLNDAARGTPGVDSVQTGAQVSGYGIVSPAGGTISSVFGDMRDGGSRQHLSGDIAANAGDPVYAPSTMIIDAFGTGGTNLNSNDSWVWAHDAVTGYQYHFAHITVDGLIVGQRFEQGNQFSTVGGAISGTHVHFQVKTPGGDSVDWISQAGLVKGNSIGARVKLDGSGIGMPGTGGGNNATATGSSGVPIPSGERGFGFYDHDYRADKNYVRAADSFTASRDSMGYMGKELSYGGQVSLKLINDKTTINMPNPGNQMLNQEGASQLFKAFVNTKRDKTLTMRRAYPAFALYFNDEFRRGFSFLTNSYRWDMVKEIRLIRSRKNPVDTLIVELSNARGNLMTQQFNSLTQTDDEKAVSFNRQVLKEGTDVKLKLGYSNDPDKLDLVFTGKITEIEGHNSAIITIVCQSYAIELFQAEQGNDANKKLGWFNSDTREIISSLLILPECVHLGRWQPGQSLQLGESGSQSAGTGYFDWAKYSFGIIKNPTDNNVFVPDQSYFWGNFGHYYHTHSFWRIITSLDFPWQEMKYVPYHQLPWEIIDEMTLRHPGYVAYVVPYEGFGHHKATLFFGPPCVNYYFKALDDGSAKQLNEMGLIQTNWLSGAARALGLTSQKPVSTSAAFNYQMLSDAEKNKANALMTSRMKPFRQYFWIDSEHHLIDNGIVTSARDTFNAVEVAFVEDAKTAMPTTGGSPDPSNFYTSGEMRVKCNESLREDYCRWFSTRERNCEGDLLAQRYATGYLFKGLKDLYQGEIVITGEPAIKPYDAIVLYDSYNDIAGPIEVEQVTHIFSSETGFISVITPDLVVQCNEIASMGILDAVTTVFTRQWFGYQKPGFNSGLSGAVDLGDLAWAGMPNQGDIGVKSSAIDRTAYGVGAAMLPLTAALVSIPFSVFMAFGGLCFFEWARSQFPIRVTPLVWKGRPFVCGLDGFTIDSAWGRAVDGAYRAFKGLGDFVDQARSGIGDLISR
jgi:hypothetical protein